MQLTINKNEFETQSDIVVTYTVEEIDCVIEVDILGYEMHPEFIGIENEIHNDINDYVQAEINHDYNNADRIKAIHRQQEKENRH